VQKESIKSVHITNYYHKNSGGISTAYNKLLEAANHHRRPVRLIVPGEKADTEEVGEFGRIYYIKANYSPIFDKRYRVMLPWKTYIFDKAPIKAILRQEKPDIIEIGEKYSLSLMAGLLRKGIMNVSPKRPMLIHLSCERMDDNISSFVSDSGILRWFSRRYMGNYAFPMFDFHLTNSDYTAQELFNSVATDKNLRRSEFLFNFCWRTFRAAKIPVRERVFVNLCGVDNVTFNVSRQSSEMRRKILQEYDLPETSKILLYVGRISPEKNINLLIELMKVLAKDAENDYRLLIAGDGPKLEFLKTESRKIGSEKVKILGFIAEEKLADLYANADIFVHPNPREPFGIAPLEAMASGISVVAPNSGGVLSYARDENVWLAEPNAASFAQAVREVFTDENRRDMKIKKALETAAQNTWELSTNRLFALYDKLYEEFSRNREFYDYRKNGVRTNFSKEFASKV
jgi:glycosyltransferase involved in cell wall biosynthesis